MPQTIRVGLGSILWICESPKPGTVRHAGMRGASRSM